MPTATLADGRAVVYADAGAGPPLVLLHAFPMDGRMWRPQIEALSDTHRVLAPDFPGFGGSSPADEMTIEGMADAVAGFLDAVGVTGPVMLAGLSMGGYVAFAFARKHPGRLRALVLADTKPEPDDDAAKATRDKLHAALTGGEKDAAGLVADMLPKLLGDTTRAGRPDVVAEVTRIGASQSVAGVAAAVRALRDRPDAGPGLGNIRVPTLVVVGAQDAITPPAGAKATAGRVAGAEFVELADAGHLANLETPAAFTAAVRNFLGRIEV